MILVRLSAFNGRLRSEPFEWISETTYIDMPFSKHLTRGFNLGIDALTRMTEQHTARFEFTGRYENYQEGSVAIYELVDI